VGGGTPTPLSAAELDRLLGALRERFDLTACRELTVEAGRPDTVTSEKLSVLKSRGVDRVSVNPQTMSDAVLAAIGRHHTVGQVYDAVAMVKDAGGLALNMDLIAGLPGDTPETFEATVEAVLSLKPENITVHTLALKKGSRFLTEGADLPDGAAVGEMLACAREKLTAGGYAPYYIYRQKFMSGSFENVGWTTPGHENIYNICIMEELCSILAMGAGGSTKLIAPGGVVKRLMAPKYPREYMERIDDTCAAKARIGAFYAENSEK
jgi:oxygen-independent coproporphyrinogen-3 oxidase